MAQRFRPPERALVKRLDLRKGGFVSFDLDVARWLALISPGVVLGLLIARLSDTSFLVWGILGGLTIWLAAVSIDRTISGHRETRHVVVPSLTPTELQEVGEAARYAGIKVDHVSDLDSPDTDTGSVFTMKSKFVKRFDNLVDVVRERSRYTSS